MKYKGYNPSQTTPIPTIDITTIESDRTKFFLDYIIPRKPCIIQGFFSDPSFDISSWASLDALKEKVDKDVKIEVEFKDESGRFGKGKRCEMTFCDFIDKIKAGETKYYLTSQVSEEIDALGSCIMQEPVKSLVNDIMMRPYLLGDLGM